MPVRDLTALAWPGLVALRKPIGGALFLAVLCLLTVVFLPTLTFDKDVHRAFGSGHGGPDYARSFSADAGDVPSEILVLVQTGAPFRSEDYAAVRDLSLELELVEGVEAVASIASARFPRNHSRLPDHPLLPFDLSEIDLDSRLDAYETALPGVRPFISADKCCLCHM